MTKCMLLASVVLLTGVAAGQNQSNKATGAQSDPASTKSADVTVQGCVTGGERYTLMQVSTGAMFGLAGDSSRFAPFQGKVAEVTASELPW